MTLLKKYPLLHLVGIFAVGAHYDRCDGKQVKLSDLGLSMCKFRIAMAPSDYTIIP